MTPNPLPLMLALLLGAAAVPALADDTGQDGTPAGAPGQVRVVTDGATTVHFGSMSTAHGRAVFGMTTVRNAPYSAQAVSERQQTLGDGNQINQRRDTSTWYRDSAGRTRLETRDAHGELRTVTINDPVAGAAWTLDPRKRIAFKVPVRGRTREQARREAADNARASEAVTALATAEAARTRTDAGRDGGEDVIVKRVERAERDGGRHLTTEVGIRMPQVIGPNGTLRDDGSLGQALANALNDRQWKKNTVTRDLGTRTFDGVKAEGKLRSYEIPAGEIGNRNPIVVSDETWYAPELQITVYTKHSDPRSGDTVFRLENLKREEPAAALFGVPSDYTVKDLLARTPKAP